MEFLRRFAKALRSRSGFGAAALMLLVIVYVIASVHLMAPSYMVNDNIAIMDHAIQGWPIDFIGVLFTRFLHLAYGAAPGVAWYGLSLYALHCVSVFLWLRLIWRVFRPWWLACTLSSILLLYYCFFLIFLDYTSTAAMLCMVALCRVFLDALERRPGYGRFALSGSVFMLGMLTRPQAVLGAMAYGFPMACIVAFWCMKSGATEERAGSARLAVLKAMPFGLLIAPVYRPVFPFRHELKRLSLIALLFLLLPALDVAGDSLYRQHTATPQQTRFETFNAVRGRLHGLPDSRQRQLINDPLAQDAARLSREQVSTFLNWRFLDERVYTAPALETLLKMLPPPEHPYADFMRELHSRFRPTPEFLLLLGCVPFFLLIVARNPGIGAAGMLLPLYALGFAALFSVFIDFSPRTELPFAFGFGFMNLIIAGFFVRQSGEDRKSRYIACAIAACALGLVGANKVLVGTGLREVDTQLIAARTRQTLAALNSGYAGSVVIVDPEQGLRRYTLSPFEVIPLRFHPIDLGWNTFSPFFYQEIGRLGIHHGYDLLDAMIDREHAYMLGGSWWVYTMLDSEAGKHVRPIKPIRVLGLYPGAGLYRYVFDRQPGAAAKRDSTR